MSDEDFVLQLAKAASKDPEQRAMVETYLKWRQGWPIDQRWHDLPRFTYSNLNISSNRRNIRLLKLLPAESDFVRVQIVEVCLDSALPPKYEALSYCWGDPTSKRPVFVDHGPDQRCIIMVTKNLFDALKRLRLPSNERVLWVDAICINQDDTEEKTVQVKMMRDIYHSSQRVVIWLGEASKNSDEALDLIPKLNRAKQLDVKENTTTNLWSVTGERRGLPEAHKQIWYDLFAVLERDWFCRAWIVQEVAVSPRATVYCGDVRFEWDSLVEAINYLLEGGLGMTLGLNAVQQLHNLSEHRSINRNATEVLRILLQNKKAKATDLRDHVFAFHGFFEAGSIGHTVTLPRYNVECRDLYIDVALQLLKHYNNLDILSVCDPFLNTTVELPSWVPNWSTGDHGESLLWRMIHPDFTPEHRPVYRASGGSIYIPRHNQKDNSIILHGVVVDEVNMTAGALDKSPDHLMLEDRTAMFQHSIRDQRVLSSWEYVAGIYKLRGRYLTGETHRSAYISTLLGGCYYGYDREVMERMFAEWQNTVVLMRLLQVFRLDQVWVFQTGIVLASLFYWFFVGILGLESIRKTLEVNFRGTLFMKLATPIAHRRFMKTDSGLIGLVPVATEPGDVVTLCAGSKVPLILRPKGGQWQLVGAAYVHGLMDGKVWEMITSEREPEGVLFETLLNSGSMYVGEFCLV